MYILYIYILINDNVFCLNCSVYVYIYIYTHTWHCLFECNTVFRTASHSVFVLYIRRLLFPSKDESDHVTHATYGAEVAARH